MTTAMRAHREKELSEAFGLFVEDDTDGAIKVENLGTVIRALGYNPTQKELVDLEEKYGQDGKISYVEFLEIVKASEDSKLSTDDVVQAFKVFDSDGSGFIELEEIRRILMTQGERISEEEADDLLKDADVNGDGKINYEEFAQRLMA